MIYYNQLEYTLIEENPAITLTSLISSIGGTMGLIVSISFFTLLEVAELLFLFLYAFIRSRDSNNKIEK